MSKKQEHLDTMWKEIEPQASVLTMTDEDEWKKCKHEFYGKRMLVMTEWGTIDFAPDAMSYISGGEGLSYDEYLEIMHRSGNGTRPYFERCYYEGFELGFKGEIDKLTDKKLCFKRVYVSGMRCDGIGFDGKEDHVWMDIKGFEGFKVGDCVQFEAEVYRYLKTGNGKAIDFGLREPYSVKKIDSYELPDDDELLMQRIDDMVCEVCLFSEHCYMGICIGDTEWRDNMRQMLFDHAKQLEKGN